MAFSEERLLFLSLLIFCLTTTAVSHGAIYTPPPVPRLTDRFSHVLISQGYSKLFGHSNIRMLSNGSSADLILDKLSGSGLVSRNRYNNGFFSAAIKLPDGFTSGVVIAFYLSNADVFPQNHDEIDIELLGHEKRRDWVLQTNVYGNGSVQTGREEKFYLWFDPTQHFHEYTILWNTHHIVFMVDNIPVREFVHSAATSAVYPSKPMSAFATIWDGSEWATHGGKYPVDYRYAPFVASFGEMEIEGCPWKDPKDPPGSCSRNGSGLPGLDPVGEGQEFVELSEEQISGLEWGRRKFMFYSYCQDISRYKVLPPECKAS